MAFPESAGLPAATELAKIYDLSGRVALVTGGASGLCRAIAWGFACYGADVALVDRDASVAETCAREMAAASGRRVLAFGAEVSDEGQVAAAVASATKALGPIDILVNGAGHNIRKPLIEFSQAEFDSLHTDIVDAYRPATAEENMLTDQLAEAQWRLNRARRVEAKTITLLVEDTFNYLSEENEQNEENAPPTSDPDQLIAVSFASVPNDVIYRNMQRYVTTIERSHQRCLKNLHHAQEKRRSLPPPPPVQPEPEGVKVATANHPLPEAGFQPRFVPTAPVSTPAYTDRC